jgi:hypothetical protein
LRSDCADTFTVYGMPLPAILHAPLPLGDPRSTRPQARYCSGRTSLPTPESRACALAVRPWASRSRCGAVVASACLIVPHAIGVNHHAPLPLDDPRSARLPVPDPQAQSCGSAPARALRPPIVPPSAFPLGVVPGWSNVAACSPIHRMASLVAAPHWGA